MYMYMINMIQIYSIATHTHILAFEGDSQVYFFEGGFSEYEESKKKRLGGDLMPKRIKYKKLVR